MEIDRLALELIPNLSTTCTNMPVVPPTVVGVPETKPFELKDKPVGQVPPIVDQVKGAAPPDTVRFCE